MLEIFVIFIISYILGSIKVKGISFGASTIIVVSMVFGHFGFNISPDLKNLGLLLFVCCVGFQSGPTFMANFKKNAKVYMFNGFLIVSSAAAVVFALIKLFSVDTRIALGLFTGALTSTPGFAIASELSNSSLTTAAYGISYPFGVICVTLFCQFMSRNITTMHEVTTSINTDIQRYGKTIDKTGILNLSLGIVLGILIGKIRIPLPGGLSFGFGNSGGPLISGIILGSIGSIGEYSLSIEKRTLNVLKNFGLSLFLLGSGLEAGSDIVNIISEHGISLFIFGAIITVVPMIVSYLYTTKVVKLPLNNALGSICGGMTSTPALGSMTQNVNDNDIISSYAATYPIALVCVILFSQTIYLFFS